MLGGTGRHQKFQKQKQAAKGMWTQRVYVKVIEAEEKFHNITRHTFVAGQGVDL